MVYRIGNIQQLLVQHHAQQFVEPMYKHDEACSTALAFDLIKKAVLGSTRRLDNLRGGTCRYSCHCERRIKESSSAQLHC